jgi:hypothetical protein
MMTTLEQIKQDLAHLDEQQLQQVADFIASVKRLESPLSGRKNILRFLEDARSRHTSRSAEEIDRNLQMERDSWDS